MTWSLPLDDFDNIATQGKKFPLHSLIKEILENADSPTLPSTDQKHQQPTFKVKWFFSVALNTFFLIW